MIGANIPRIFLRHRRGRQIRCLRSQSSNMLEINFAGEISSGTRPCRNNENICFEFTQFIGKRIDEWRRRYDREWKMYEKEIGKARNGIEDARKNLEELTTEVTIRETRGARYGKYFRSISVATG